MDNAIFNVNGKTHNDLLQTLTLAFNQKGANTTAVGWTTSPSHGLIFLWSMDSADGQRLPVPLNAELCADVAYTWLAGKEAESIIPTGTWDIDLGHDGHNSKGFRVFKEDWGHVNGSWKAICAVMPVYLWHGK